MVEKGHLGATLVNQSYTVVFPARNKSSYKRVCFLLCRFVFQFAILLMITSKCGAMNARASNRKCISSLTVIEKNLARKSGKKKL